MEAQRGLAWSAPSSVAAPVAVASSPRLSCVWPVGYVLAVLYISLLPFDFSLTTFNNAISEGLGSLRFRSTTPDDATANILVYLPVGLLLGLYAMRGRWGRWVGALLAVVIGTTLSILVETLQTGLVSRVASCTDVLLNCVGTAVGACFGVSLQGTIRAAIAQLRRELADRPFTTAASMLTLGLFLYNLAPFDFVMTTDALHASFGRAHWGLMSVRAPTIGAAPFAALAQQLTGAGWFTVLGYLLALGGCEGGRHPAVSLGSAWKNGLILVALVEFMQLFTRSHTFDAATVMIRSLGVIFGAWCAVFIIGSMTGSAWRRKASLSVPTGILVILAVFQVSLLIAPCICPVGGLFTSERPFVVKWLPFETTWRHPFETATAEILSSLMTYGTLAFTLRVLYRRFRVVHPGWWAFAALTLTATTCEGLRLMILGKPMDVTTPFLAWFAAYLVAGSWSALNDPTSVSRGGNRPAGISSCR